MESGRSTLLQLADDLASGKTSSHRLTEGCLARIADRAGEGARTFLHVDPAAALSSAAAMDQLRSAGAAPSRFAGIPISIKDLFDVAGQVTRAGSRVLEGAARAEIDAAAVSRLRRAGFVLIGRTNMTEFAYSGLGLNPHFGTPLNSWDRSSARIPGGSSSGAAISVANGMAHAALGTDTGGSVRIPAAFNGLVGFKPTASRISLRGALPLSPTLDSIGPIARTVQCCAILDSILTDDPLAPELTQTSMSTNGLRLAIPQAVMLDDLDSIVARSFSDAVDRLSRAGASLTEVPIPELKTVASMNVKGGFTAAESLAWHQTLIESHGAAYDPRVRARILRGKEQSAVDYIELVKARQKLILEVNRTLSGFHALICPTAPIVPPRLVDLEEDRDFNAINLLVLRNPSLVNMFDGCAISIPIHAPGNAPVGLMLAAPGGQDAALLDVAALIERSLMPA
jgi:aspartyl-tRNA(Asn)/glutamyl-tRNA(Gln) amidotransferase subunit A